MHYKHCFDLCANDPPFEKNFYCTCTFSTDRPTDRSFEFDWTFIQTIEYLANLMSLSRTVVCSSSTCIVLYGTVLYSVHTTVYQIWNTIHKRLANVVEYVWKLKCWNVERNTLMVEWMNDRMATTKIMRTEWIHWTQHHKQ